MPSVLDTVDIGHRLLMLRINISPMSGIAVVFLLSNRPVRDRVYPVDAQNPVFSMKLDYTLEAGAILLGVESDT